MKGWGSLRAFAFFPITNGATRRRLSGELSRSAPKDITYLGIDARTGAIGGPNGWRVAGFGKVTVYSNGDFAEFSAGERLPKGF